MAEQQGSEDKRVCKEMTRQQVLNAQEKLKDLNDTYGEILRKKVLETQKGLSKYISSIRD